jgi:exodeoxyribonuclease VII large subunit
MRLLFDSITTPPTAALSVGELAEQVKRVVESDPILCDISAHGEISNFKEHSSGHLYFTLKDESAQITCKMWRHSVRRLRFRPSNGDRVGAWGSIEFYNARGEVNFIVRDLRFDGQGAQFEAFERLKQQLAAEGLFDEERKRPLPSMPRRIGLITSATGAVAHDVITVLRRRWPLATVLFIPAAVQGFTAVPDLIRALSWAAAVDDLDVVIMARGGGSAEDLWCFNDEDLVRAVAEFPKPLISAIGHETDYTILDFVADLRAPTPSAAAEMVAPELERVQAAVDGLRWRLYNAVAGDVKLARQTLDSLRKQRVLTRPGARLEAARTQVRQLRTQVRDAIERRVKIERQALDARRAQLRALDPQRVLERGYSLADNAATGQLIRSAHDVRPGQKLTLTLQDGTVHVTVDAVSTASSREVREC